MNQDYITKWENLGIDIMSPTKYPSIVGFLGREQLARHLTGKQAKLVTIVADLGIPTTLDSRTWKIAMNKAHYNLKVLLMLAVQNCLDVDIDMDSPTQTAQVERIQLLRSIALIPVVVHGRSPDAKFIETYRKGKIQEARLDGELRKMLTEALKERGLE